MRKIRTFQKKFLLNKEEKVSAYVIVEIKVTDPQLYEDYKKLAPACVAAYGGEYLARAL